MKYTLTIAGSDPTGGAGLQADIAVFSILGMHGLSVATALTAQNTKGVEATLGVDEAFVGHQLRCLLGDITPGALKTGMLHSAGAVRAVCRAMQEFKLNNLVVDPVCVSSSGHKLLDDEGFEVMRAELLAHATVVTPNIPEAIALTGIVIKTVDDMADAARAIMKLGAKVVVLKGGHMDGDPVDIYCDQRGIRKIEGRRVEGDFHGTGCVYSAALAGYLCMGETPYDAAIGAKHFINEAIKGAHRPGGGAALLELI